MALADLEKVDGVPHCKAHRSAVLALPNAVELAVIVDCSARRAVVVAVNNGGDMVLGDDVGNNGAAGDDLHDCNSSLCRLLWFGRACALPIEC